MALCGFDSTKFISNNVLEELICFEHCFRFAEQLLTVLRGDSEYKQSLAMAMAKSKCQAKWKIIWNIVIRRSGTTTTNTTQTRRKNMNESFSVSVHVLKWNRNEIQIMFRVANSKQCKVSLTWQETRTVKLSNSGRLSIQRTAKWRYYERLFISFMDFFRPFVCLAAHFFASPVFNVDHCCVCFKRAPIKSVLWIIVSS